MRSVIRAVAFGGGVLALNVLGARLAQPDDGLVAMWPAAGLNVAVFALTRPRWWLPLIAGTMAATYFGATTEGFDSAEAALSSVAGLIQGAFGGFVLRRLPRRTLTLRRPIDVVVVVALGGVAASLVAIGPAVAGIQRARPEFGSAASIVTQTLAAHSLGFFVIAPIVLAFWGLRHDYRSRRFLAESAAAVVAVTAVAVVLFGDVVRFGRFPQAEPFVAISMMVWPVARLDLLAVSLSFAGLAIPAAWFTIRQTGPVAILDQPLADQLIGLQIAMFTSGVVAFGAHSVIARTRSIAQRLWKSEARSRAQEQELRSLASTVPVGIFRADRHGRCVYVNEHWTMLAGIDAEACAGAGWLDAVHPHDRPDVALAWDAVRQNGLPLSVKTRVLRGRAGDHERWVSLRIEPIREQGMLHGYVGAMSDVTADVEAEHAKSLFVATASHELRTPLTVIHGFAQTLVDERPLSERERSYMLRAIVDRSAGLARIVDRLLLASRVEAGVLGSLRGPPVDLRKAVVEPIESLASATGRAVRIEVMAGSLSPTVSRDGLITVIEHLVDNAFKYSPAGGEVLVRVTPRDGFVAIEVADDGIGMSDEERARCFERFWQADTGDARRFGGSGLGLYIVASLVRAMDGAVEVFSEPGVGSTFCVTLPVGDPDEDPPPTAR